MIVSDENEIGLRQRAIIGDLAEGIDLDRQAFKGQHERGVAEEGDLERPLGGRDDVLFVLGRRRDGGQTKDQESQGQGESFHGIPPIRFGLIILFSERKKPLPWHRDSDIIRPRAMRKNLFIRIFLGYAAVIGILFLGVEIFAPPAMQDHHIQERSDSLKNMAFILEAQIVPYLTGANPGDLAGLVAAYGRSTETRITVIDAKGTVLADSEREARDMENHLFRPEIQASLRGETQMSIRPSSTLGVDMMYLSVQIRRHSERVEAPGRIWRSQ